MGWVTGVFTLAYGLFEVPTGVIGDRLGPRRVLTRIVVWWSAFTMLTGAATAFYPLLLTRFLFRRRRSRRIPERVDRGVALVRAGERATMSGVNIIASQVGGALAPLLVVPIQSRYGWRASFFVFGAAGLVWSGLARVVPGLPGGETGAALHRLPSQDTPRSIARRGVWRPGRKRCGRCSAWRSLSDGTTSSRCRFTPSWCAAGTSAEPACCSRRRRSSSPRRRTGGGAPATRWYGGSAPPVAGGDRLHGSDRGRPGRPRRDAHAASGADRDLLTVCYGAITFQQSGVFGVCLDIGGPRAGAMVGMMNTAAQVGGLAGRVLYGYIVDRSGSYDAPFVPMAACCSLERCSG